MNFEEKDLEFIKICKRNGLTPLKFAEIRSTDSDSFTVTRHFYVPESQMTSFITYVCKGGIFEILKVSLEDMNFKPEMLINLGEVLKNLEKEIRKN